MVDYLLKDPAAEAPGSAGAAGQGLRLYAGGAKRALDVLLTLAAAPFALPLVAALALLVRLDGGPAFFGQRRIGRHGRVFTCWKLRTMAPGAEDRLAEHLAADPRAAAEWARDQKLRCDPRVTRFGDFLRRSSLDELPQLWNVLRGEMSLVGPRPFMESQLGIYRGRAYFRMRPGLTGPWQVGARNGASFESRAAYDESYERDVSLPTDFALMLRTVGVVVRGGGR